MTDQKIKIQKDGPYLVQGNVPLVRKAQVSSEHGEPMTWEKTGEEASHEEYELCRCGQSSHKPFCDMTHKKVQFDGTETADTNTFEERKVIHEGSTKITIKRDYSICAQSGFCGNRLTNIKKMANKTDESTVRAEVMEMIDRCPSGSYTYSLTEDGQDIEVDLPKQIAITADMTSKGPILGPLWVTGYIEVERSDGEPMEIRNRVALCRCGKSANKPLCDGTHRALGIPE